MAHGDLGVYLLLLGAVILLLVAFSLDRLDKQRLAAVLELERTARLTAALAVSASVRDVTRAILDVGLQALGADAGAVILCVDGHNLEVRGTQGFSEDHFRKHVLIPTDSDAPSARAFREGVPIFADADALLPLIGAKRPLGVLALSFRSAMSLRERDRILGLASHCSQAFDRALLLQSETSVRHRLQAAIDGAAVGTYFFNFEEDRVEHDIGCKHAFGFPPDAGDELDAYTVRIHPDDRDGWLRALEASRVSGDDFDTRYRVVQPSGTMRWIIDKARVVKDATGRPISMHGAIVDVTREHEALDAAEAANRAKDQFLALLGHELRNPLAPLLTALDLMELTEPATFKRERDIMERQVRHMVRLIDDLLDVSRIARGKIELKKARIGLHRVLHRAVEATAPVFEEHHHRLTMHEPDAELFVDGDEERLVQVVTNLLVNAAKYTRRGGHVTVTLSAGERAELKVSDDGQGITAELLPRVFDLFSQAEQSFDRAKGGLGLGLSIAKSIVVLHGGTISAHSAGPDKGSHFVVSLPLAPAATAIITHTNDRDTAPMRPRRVLIVEDNRDAAEMFAEGLRRHGHDIHLAYDGPAGLAMALELLPEVAFIDLGLPTMDGFEVARNLARRAPKVRLVAVTGYGQAGDRARSTEAGFSAHLVKPIDLSSVLAILRS